VLDVDNLNEFDHTRPHPTDVQVDSPCPLAMRMKGALVPNLDLSATSASLTGKSKFKLHAADPSPRRAVKRNKSPFKSNRSIGHNSGEIAVLNAKKRARLSDEVVTAIRDKVHGISPNVQSKLMEFDKANRGFVSRHEFEQTVYELESSSSGEKQALSRILNSSEWDTISYKNLKLFVNDDANSRQMGSLGKSALPMEEDGGSGSFGEVASRPPIQQRPGNKFPSGALKLPPMKTGSQIERLYGEMSLVSAQNIIPRNRVSPSRSFTNRPHGNFGRSGIRAQSNIEMSVESTSSKVEGSGQNMQSQSYNAKVQGWKLER